jgi:hypothetical protein
MQVELLFGAEMVESVQPQRQQLPVLSLAVAVVVPPVLHQRLAKVVMEKLSSPYSRLNWRN